MGKESVVTFQTPRTIKYGRGALQSVGEIALKKGKKALIISDEVIEDLGYLKECQNVLKSAKIESVLYLGVKSEPTDEYVSEALQIFNEKKCDIIISLGGGSCIDTAKAVAVVATNGGYIGDYMGEKKIAEKRAIPHIAIPTTAGTGSEVTDVTVITNSSNDVKMMIKQPVFLPDAAIVDPILTVSSPKSVTAATGVDALSHAIEAYISKKANPLTDTFALSAMKLIVNNLKKCYVDRNDLDAREAMALGALQAGLAFSNASVCLVHGMSRPIGALFNVPHGFSNAMLLPAVLEFSQKEATDRLADLGRIFAEDSETFTDEEAADFAVESVKKLCSDLNIPNIKGWGIDREKFKQQLDKMAKDALESGSPQNNPRVPTEDEIKQLYLDCYDYEFKTKRVFK